MNSAAVMVLDHVPDEDEIEELALGHLDEFDAEDAHATTEILYSSPTWMDMCERDQIDAHLRDGGVCVLVVYMVDDTGDVYDD